MNREDIIRMAREAEKLWVQHGDEFDSNRFLEIFAALVAAHEREACAKVCEDAISPYVTDSGGMKLVTLALATAIRKRGEVQP